MKKQLFILFLLVSNFCNAQGFVDLFSINYGKSAATTYENSSQSTTISNFETNLTLPIQLNEKYTVITGGDFSFNKLQLFPDSNYNNLYLTRVKAGVNITHSERWSGTYMLLAKFSSDYINLSSDDFYTGGVAVLKYKKNKNLGYKFGLYASKEAYGLFVSPIIGFYYLSPSNRFEMNFYLPNDADINYKLSEKTKTGIDFVASGKTFKLTTNNARSSYVENNALEFSSYLQNNSLCKNILVRLKAGFSTNNFKVYPIDQKIDFATSLLRFGDHRTQLNKDLSIGFFAKIEAIYRFDIASK